MKINDLIGFLKKKGQGILDSTNIDERIGGAFSSKQPMLSPQPLKTPNATAYQTKPLSLGQKFWMSGAGQTLAGQKSIPRLNLTESKPVQSIQNPIARFAVQAPLSVAESFANIPSNLAQGVVNTGSYMGQVAHGSQPLSAYKLGANVAPFAVGMLDLGTAGLGGTGLAKQGLKVVGKQTLKNAVKKGAITGAGYGGVQSFLTELGNQREKQDVAKLGTATYTGIAGGALLGGAMGGAGKLLNEKLLRIVTRNEPKISPQEAQNKVNRFIQDTVTGKMKGSVKIKKEPVYYGDMRESLGLSRNGDVKMGFSVQNISGKSLKEIEEAKNIKVVSPSINQPLKIAGSSQQPPLSNPKVQTGPSASSTLSERVLNNSDLPTSNKIISSTKKLADNVEQIGKQKEANIVNSEVAKSVREMFNDGQIKLINELKKISRSKAFIDGDIETLRKTGKADTLEQALEAVREVRPDLVDDTAALDFALNLPTKSETVVKRVNLTPEEKALRVQAAKEQKVFESEFGRTASAKEQEKAIAEWEKQIRSETISPSAKAVNERQTVRIQERANRNLTNEWMDSYDGKTTGAYKGGSLYNVSHNFPSKQLSGASTDKNPFSYQRETLLRNIEDTFGENAPKVRAYFHDPIVKNETKNVQFKNEMRTKLGKLFDEAEIKKGSNEDYAAADYIEGNLSLEELKRAFPNKWEKIVAVADEGRATYKKLLSRINETITRYGYEPIKERQNYVTHTQQISELTNRFGSFLNFEKEKLPTEISAINMDTKPGRQFFQFGKQRVGGSTHEGLISALDSYIDPAGNQIFHTGDIQRGRALVDYLSNSNENSTNLSNFNSYISQYTDMLAGKTNVIDRPFEKVFGRGIFKLGDWARKRTGANMVGGNISSALTNFIPFTQSLATTNKLAAVKGMYEGMQAPLKQVNLIDGVESSFLTRRFPKERIASNVGEKVVSGANALFKLVDEFTSRSVVAGKYFENLQKGLSQTEAMARADEYAARVMADRSFGQSPLLFNSKVLGAFTQFQTEVNNQMSFLLKDVPKNMGYNKAQVASAMAQFAVLSYVFNNMYEKLNGRRPQIDPIHAVQSFVEGLQNGESVKDMMNPYDQNTPAGEIANSLPFTSMFTGGRLPLGSALPDPIALVKGETTLSKEVKKPLFYLLPPTGGGQIKKTLEGVDAYSQGYSETDKGAIRFPIDKNTPNAIRTTLFGQYSTPEARAYFDNNGRPLSESQSNLLRQSSDTKGLYAKITDSRKQNREEDKAREEIKSRGEGSKTVGNRYIYWDESAGEVKSVSVTEREKAKLDAKYSLTIDRAKRDNDYKTWASETEKYIQSLYEYQKKLDPVNEETEIIQIQNKIEDLLDQYEKYKGYGGFKKGKKPKSTTKKLSIKATSTPKVKLSPINIPSYKVKLSGTKSSPVKLTPLTKSSGISRVSTSERPKSRISYQPIKVKFG